jgi:ABC-2 type transport system permease protein
MPLIMTFLISAVFGSLFDANPKLGIVDEGGSEVTVAAQELDGVEVVLVDDVEGLRDLVEAHDLDAGLVLPVGFDDAVAAQRRPDLQFYVSGESLASNRVVLAVTTVDLVRGVSGEEPPVAVVVTPIGDEDYVPIGDRLLPFTVLYAVMVAALFVPAATLVDEREKRTLDAVLVTPTKLSEVLLGKAAFGVGLAMIMGLVTLALNSAFAGKPGAMTLFLLVGAIMMAELGLILGLWAKDIASMYTAVKAGGILVFLPVIFVLFPALPQWIPRVVPTYYFLVPIYDLAVGGATFGTVTLELAVAIAICIALVPVVAWVAGRSERQLAMTV